MFMKLFRIIYLKQHFLKLDPHERLKLDDQYSLILNSILTSTVRIIELPT